MITPIQVKSACNTLLADTFKTLHGPYGTDTKDGYKRPSFFTEILLSTPLTILSPTQARIGYTFQATLLEETHDEAFCLGLFADIVEAFGMVVQAGSQKMVVTEISYRFIGADADILQVTVEFADITIVKSPEETAHDLMQVIEMEVDVIPDGESYHIHIGED